MTRRPPRPGPLPTKWNLYNLEASPYFQNTLEAAEHSTAPLDLFVGRDEELEAIRSRIHGSERRGSRQAVAGMPGVGKTTLVQAVKADLLDDGFLTTDGYVPILPDDSPESLFGRVIGMIYDTVLANRPHTNDAPAMRDAQVLVRATRLLSKGGTFTIAGTGGGPTSTVTPSAPNDLMIDGPRVMRDLMALVCGSDGRGILLHINNLEALTERDASNAAEILRGLRDPMLMHPGLHVVLVGTADAVTTVVNTHPQVRSIFTVVPIAPLNTDDVHAMLDARYEYLKKDPSRPVMRPADPSAVELMYSLFRGDLRGMLKALEDGTSDLLGLVPAADGKGPRPMTGEDLRPVLKERYERELNALPEQTRVDQLRRWADVDPKAGQTQQSLQEVWDISQPAVSIALKYLIQQGLVVALPREGREATRYVLSGTSLLVFGGTPA